MEKIDGMSRDLELEAREKLKSVFPDCFAEGKLDIDKLLNICGEYIDDDFEKYEFKWKGKNDCLKLAQRRSAGTLRPCREESVDWENTENLYIEGDNLEVLKILQSSYYRKVKMIYIDPPYNTGNDFVYEDDYKDPIEKYKEVTSQTTKSNPETMGRFHTNWLNMMYPRLRLAANLLRDDGVIFISIDDNEVHNLRKLCDEVFGEENFRNIIIIRRGAKNLQAQFETIDRLNSGFEFILMYSKNINTRFNKVYSEYSDGESVGTWNNHWRGTDRPTMRYDIYGIIPEKGQWRWSKERSYAAIENYNNMLKELGTDMPTQLEIDEWYTDQLKSKGLNKVDLLRLGSTGKPEHYIVPSNRKLLNDLWDDLKPNGSIYTTRLFGENIFSNPKSVDLIRRLIGFIADDNDIILDFFSGSATTAHAVMQLNAEDGGNRRYICVQLPELCGEKSEAYKAGYKNICEIGKERIRRAGNKILAEWKEKQSKMENGENESTVPPDVGFKVFKLDTSNISAWDGYAVRNEGKEGLQKRIDEFLEGVKPGRTRLDVVYEIILKTGFPLTAKVETIDINGREVYSIDNETILICLFENVGFEDVEEMAQYAPAHIVFGEKCFADTSAVKNAKEALRDTGIDIKFF